MGSESGFVYVFVRRGGGTRYEVQKLTPTDGEAGDCFGFKVAIYGNSSVIRAGSDDIERGSSSRYGYVYTNIGGKLI